MNAVDREAFEKLMSELCAGFNVPPGDRPAAYWKGLAKMSLGQFARIVEEALGENGCEKFPTVRGVWDMHRKRMAEQRARPTIVETGPAWDGDEWDDRANRRFMGYLWRTGRAAARVYGEGKYLGHTLGVSVHPNRAARMKFLLTGKRAWSHEMRHCKPAERTQMYADSLWRELMEAAEKQAAKEVLGDEALALRDAA